jgi:benzoyl-CoA reductase subunit C
MNLEKDPFLGLSNTISNPYLEKSNKKIVGYYCTYIPEELLHAAKLFPYRIRATGNKDTDLADIYMVRFTCSFVRSTLHLALQGVYDFLDGFVVCNSCDHSRRMFEIFDLKVFNRKGFNKNVPRFYLALPHIISKEGFEWYKKEVEELKAELEKAYNIEQITNEDLLESINLYNENRSLLRKIHELRILDRPKITGSEALQISMANSSVPKEIANNELERILNILRSSEGLETRDKRILLVGSVVDNIDFIQLVENSGATIVSDFLCFGTRSFLDDIIVTPGGDPLEDISKRLYYRMSCPRMMDDHIRRLEFLKSEIKKAKIDGVLLQRINNCDLHGCDNMLFEHELKEQLGIPIFNIDRENYQADTTRLQTRIEAFLEMIT